jgi:hypothetical protein
MEQLHTLEAFPNFLTHPEQVNWKRCLLTTQMIRMKHNRVAAN